MIVEAVKFVPNDNPNDDGFWAILGLPSHEGEKQPVVVLKGYGIVARRQVEVQWHPVNALPDSYFDLPDCPGAPPLTPFEVEQKLRSNVHGTVCQAGWEFRLDGPMMSPPEAWYPVGDKDGYSFVIEGDLDDEITPSTRWLCMTKQNKLLVVPLQEPLTITVQDIQGMKKHPSLGPVYSASRRITESVVNSFGDKDFTAIVTHAAEEIAREINTRVENSLWLDLEHNLHGRFWDGVRRVINDILAGTDWAIDTYAGDTSILAHRSDLLKAIAEHIPDNIQKMQIKLLQEKVDSLEKSIEWHKSQSIRY